MTGEIVDLEVALIDPGPVVRAFGTDTEHAAALVPAVESLPPVIVRSVGDRYSLIDGAHRLEAHKIAGRGTIRGAVVDLDDAEAFEEAVKANIAHGKPLTLAERKTAAATLLALRPEWSNVRLASVVGLSDKTVAALRPTSENPRLDTRQGTDDRARPVDAEAQRNEIRVFIQRNPGVSDRFIADRVGCSPTTVGTVRIEMQTAAEPPVPASDGVAPRQPATPVAEADDPHAAESSEGQAGGDHPAPPVDPYPELTYATEAHKAAARIYEDCAVLDGSRLPAEDRGTWLALADHMTTKADEIRSAFTRPHLEAVR